MRIFVGILGVIVVDDVMLLVGDHTVFDAARDRMVRVDHLDLERSFS
jgi:hypothetical protein